MLDSPSTVSIQGVRFDAGINKQWLQIGNFVFSDDGIEDIITYLTYYKAWRQEEGNWNNGNRH